MKLNYFFAFLVGAVAFFIYQTGASPTLLSCGDSAELITASHTLGVAHAPGYALYTLTGRIFSMCLGGKPAYRLVLFTSFFGSLTLALVYLYLTRLTGKKSAGFFGAGVLGFSYHFWLFSYVPEHSAMTAFFLTLLFISVETWVEKLKMGSDNSFPWLAFASYLVGVTFSHHHVMLLFLPGLLYFVFRTARNSPFHFTGKSFSTLLTLFFLGFSPTLYVLVRAHKMPYMNAGVVTDLTRFFGHITRKNYGTVLLTPSYTELDFATVMQILGFYSESLVRSFHWPGVILGAVGFVGLIRRRPNTGVLLLSGFLLSGPAFFLAARMPANSVELKTILERFLIPSFLTFAVAAGYGAYLIFRVTAQAPITTAPLFGGSDRRPGESRGPGFKLSVYGLGPGFHRDDGLKHAGATKFFLGFSLALLPLFLIHKNYSVLNLSHFDLCEIYGKDLMKTFEKDSLVFVCGDNSVFTLWYLQQVEGERPDLKIVKTSIDQSALEAILTAYPELKIPQGLLGPELVREMIRTNIQDRAVFMVGLPGEKFSSFGLAKNPFTVQPKGLAFQIVAAFDPLDDADDLWHSYKIRKWPDHPTLQNHFAHETVNLYALSRYNQAAIQFNNGLKTLALKSVEEALVLDPAFIPAENLRAQIKRRLNK